MTGLIAREASEEDAHMVEGPADASQTTRRGRIVRDMQQYARELASWCENYCWTRMNVRITELLPDIMKYKKRWRTL